MAQFKIKTLLLAAFSIGSLIGYPTVLLAESDGLINKSSPQFSIRFNSTQRKPPKRGGNPRTSEGTGSRGDCLYQKDKPQLTRLVGGKNLQLTVDKYPKLWFHSSLSREEAPVGEFSLQHGDDEVYQTRFQLPAKPGVFSISLPPTAPGLEVGKKYRFYVEINCPSADNSDDSSTPASLTGVVERVEVSSELSRDLKAAKTPLERINVFAKYSIWLNTLTELAQLRIKQPQNTNLKNSWIELLSQPEVGLEKVSQEPIVETSSLKIEI